MPKETLVTWKQKEHSHWFGAQNADTIHRVEKLTFNKTTYAGVEPAYESYTGNLLVKMEGPGSDEIIERIAFIRNQRASVMP